MKNKIVERYLKKDNVKVYTKRVLLGIKTLDKEFKGRSWLDKIKLNSLDLSDSNKCICGQIFGDYMAMVFGNKSYYDTYINWKIDRGFYDTDETNYDLLTYVWFTELSKLKK